MKRFKPNSSIKAKIESVFSKAVYRKSKQVPETVAESCSKVLKQSKLLHSSIDCHRIRISHLVPFSILQKSTKYLLQLPAIFIPRKQTKIKNVDPKIAITHTKFKPQQRDFVIIPLGHCLSWCVVYLRHFINLDGQCFVRV